MATMTSAFSIILVFAILTIAHGNHIRLGKDADEGEYTADDGSVKKYRAISTIKQPIVCWQDLVKDGLTIEKCTDSQIVFRGNYDKEDFKRGNVVTFIKDEYADLGCPPSPLTGALARVDQVVFRRIKSAVGKGDRIVVKTKHVSGKNVIPEVFVQVGTPTGESAVSRLPEDEVDLREITSRRDLGSLNYLFSNTNTYDFFKVKYDVNFYGGVCDFSFSRQFRKATFTIILGATSTMTVTVFKKFSLIEKQLFTISVPGLGFTLRLGTLGTFTGGIYVGAKAVADFALEAQAQLKVTGNILSRQEVVIDRESYGLTTRVVSGSFGGSPLSNGKDPQFTVDNSLDVSTGRSVTAFAGLRPFIGAGFNRLPFIGECDAELLGTAGIEAVMQINTGGYSPVTTGATVGSCDSCHYMQSALKFRAKNLDFNATCGSFNRVIPIKKNIGSTNLATACLGSKSC